MKAWNHQPFKSARLLCILATSAAALSVSSIAADAVRLHGAVSMEKLFSAQKAALESQCGTKLEIVGNGSGRGLVDLSAGAADVAMIGGSLKAVAEACNKDKAGSVNAAGMQEVALAKLKLAVITHPAAGAKNLTVAQLRDLLTGKVKSWKEVGGADVPVKVVLPFAGDGARVSIQEAVLPEAEFAKDAVLRNSSKDICMVVGQLAGACSFVTEKNLSGQVATVAVDQELFMPMQLVHKGDCPENVKKVVEASKNLIKP